MIMTMCEYTNNVRVLTPLETACSSLGSTMSVGLLDECRCESREIARTMPSRTKAIVC